MLVPLTYCLCGLEAEIFKESMGEHIKKNSL